MSTHIFRFSKFLEGDRKMYERYLELLKSTGVKSSDVAKATGIPPSTFSDWKRGKSSPKYEKLQKIANYFGVKADWLQGTSEYKTDDELYSKLAEDNMFTPTIENVQAHYSASSMSKFGHDWKDKIKKALSFLSSEQVEQAFLIWQLKKLIMTIQTNGKK